MTLFDLTRLVVAAWIGAAQVAEAPRELTDATLQPRIHDAIDAGIAYLEGQQHRDGTWTGAAFGSYRTGPTAFTAYALVESGVSPDSASIRLALDYLERTPPTMVYSAGAILLLLSEVGGDEHLDLAEACLDQLLEWESASLRGTWSYPSGPVDLSNMQFVALGFWGAQRLGLDVPHDVVERLVEATIERFQEEPFLPTTDGTKGQRGRSRKDSLVAGFHYFLERDRRIPTGSMTAAGICIQRIARELSGKKLGSRLLRTMDASEALGLRWLGAHWSVEENHGHHEEGQQLLYYLYALERLGSFYGTETIDGHPWYEPGARVLLARQKESGSWGRLHESAYALLFLGRASRVGSTGAKARRRDDAWQLDSGPVGIHANGSMEIVAWLTSLEAKDESLFVDAVEWRIDDEVVDVVESKDAARPWSGERFPLRWTSETVGPRSLRACLHARRADGTELKIASAELVIECRRTPAEWMSKALAARGENLLAEIPVEAQASSQAAGQDPARAVDGYEGTAWIAGGEPEPRLDLKLGRKGVRARSVTLTHAASSVARLPEFAGVERIRLTVNGTSSEHALPPQSAAPIVIPLPKRQRVETLVVEILEPKAGKRGFAEVGLR